MFNKWLEESGLTLKIPLDSGGLARIFIVEYDAKKAHFPEVLSLKMPIITRYDGRPFHEFLDDPSPLQGFLCWGLGC